VRGVKARVANGEHALCRALSAEENGAARGSGERQVAKKRGRRSRSAGRRGTAYRRCEARAAAREVVGHAGGGRPVLVGRRGGS